MYDIAHVAWRMRVATELEAAINKLTEVGVCLLPAEACPWRVCCTFWILSSWLWRPGSLRTLL